MTQWAIAIGLLLATQAGCARREAPPPSPSPPTPVAPGRDAAAPLSLEDYFPPDRFRPDMQPFMTAWYGQSLRGLAEPSLWPTSGGGRRAIRLLYLRSFLPTLAVRLERDGEVVQLTATRAHGSEDMNHGGFDPGPIELRRELSLAPADWDRIDGLLDAASFATMPLDAEIGFDGSDWIVERAERGDYRMVVRWSPEPGGPDGAYRRACEALLALAGADFALTAR